MTLRNVLITATIASLPLSFAGSHAFPAFAGSVARTARSPIKPIFTKEKDEQEEKEAMEAAAIDAHDLSDPGMEAASEERAVALAKEFAAERKKQKKPERNDGDSTTNTHAPTKRE